MMVDGNANSLPILVHEFMKGNPYFLVKFKTHSAAG
jgi:hypothetical protein